MTALTAPETDRKADILDRTVEYILETGISDLSLRPLAAALGTSARMLIYYFGSKDALVIDALEEIRRRQYADLDPLKSGAAEGALRRYWRWTSARERRAYVRLRLEVSMLSLHEPARYRQFLTDDTQHWLRFIEQSLRSASLPEREVSTLSTLTVAAMNGLELDLVATGDLDRLNDAFDELERLFGQRVNEILAGTASG
jgi:AcrR family transcriptional regulator